MKKILVLLMLTFSLFGCADQIDKRYDRDSQFGGSLYSLIESKGEYKLFLEAVNSADMTRSLNGRGIHSVMAPNDEVFQAYLKKRGLTSVSDLSKDELASIVRTHIVDKPFSREMIREFMEITPMRLHTMYQKPVEKQFYPLEGVEKFVYQGNKLMPIFTPENWEEQKIKDIAYNYDYFYDNKWQSGNWKYGEATVSPEVEQVGNGFLYKVDQVLEAPLNIEQYLTKDSEGPTYKTLMKLFETNLLFIHDAELNKDYNNNRDSVFMKLYFALDIANEYIGSSAYSSDYPEAMQGNQTLIAPNDVVLDEFINTYLINEHWTSFDEIPMFNRVMLLSGLCVINSVWPEKIDDGLALGNYSIPIKFSTQNDVENRYICSNGLFYGLNKMPEMVLFNTVMKELVTNPNYTYMAHMLLQSSHLGRVSSTFEDFTFLLPTDDSWGEVGLSIDFGETEILGDEKLNYTNVATGEEVAANRATISRFVGNHILLGTPINLTTKGYKLYETVNSFGVVLLKDIYSGEDGTTLDGYGAVSDGLMENNDGVLFEGELKSAENGKYVYINKPLSFGQLPLASALGTLDADKGQDTAFVNLMKGANLLIQNPDNEVVWGIRSIVSGYTTVFIPSDAAMKEAKDNDFFPIRPADFEEESPEAPADDASQADINKYEVNLAAFLLRKAEADRNMWKYSLWVEKFVKNYIVPMTPFEKLQYLLPKQNIDEPLVYDVRLIHNENEDYEVGLHVVMNENGVNRVSNLSKTESANVILDKNIVICKNALIYTLDKVIDFNK